MQWHVHGRFSGGRGQKQMQTPVLKCSVGQPSLRLLFLCPIVFVLSYRSSKKDLQNSLFFGTQKKIFKFFFFFFFFFSFLLLLLHCVFFFAFLLSREPLNKMEIAVSIMIGNVAVVLQMLGDYAVAAKLQEEAKDFFERNYGPTHKRTANAYNNLGVLYQKTREFEKAETVGLKSLQISQVRFGLVGWCLSLFVVGGGACMIWFAFALTLGIGIGLWCWALAFAIGTGMGIGIGTTIPTWLGCCSGGVTSLSFCIACWYGQ